MHNMMKKRKLYKAGKKENDRNCFKEYITSMVYFCAYWTFVVYIKHLWNHGVEHISQSSANIRTESQPSKISRYSRRDRDIKQ